MSLAEFVVDGGRLEAGGTVRLTGQEHRHLARVRRFKPGDLVQLSDGKGCLALCKVVAVERETTSLEVLELSRTQGDLLNLVVVLGLIKRERMEWAIQKLAELGVSRILPVTMARSVVRLDPSRAERQLLRWQRIAIEAMKQSRGTVVTEVARPVMFQQAMEDLGPRAALAYLHPAENEGRGCHLFHVLQDVDKEDGPVVVVIGPEGGFTREELQMLQDCGGRPALLGRRILRSETAAVAAGVVFSTWVEASSVRGGASPNAGESDQ